MSKFVLLAETGSDVTAQIAKRRGIYLVPMHVSMGEETRDDGSFPAREVIEFYEKTGTLPKTSGSMPEDFETVFNRIHREHPDKHILHLAYSAVTTCSFQSAQLAAEGRDYVTSIDTKQVAAGQAAIVLKMQDYLDQNPYASLEEVLAQAQKLIDSARMAFVPQTLDFLHAGGRLSNAAFVAGKILNIHPRVELKNGYLVATKKYRGQMDKIVAKLVEEMTQMYSLKKDCLWMLRAPGLAQEVQEAAQKAAREHGFQRVEWIDTGCVITTHSGPGAFGVVGFE